MISKLQNFLVNLDKVVDYVPFVSTATNFVDLFEKYVVLPKMSGETIKENRYYTHIEDKSGFRSLCLLVPFLGNIVIGILDIVSWKKNKKGITKEDVLKIVKFKGVTLGDPLFKEFTKDKEVVLEAVRNNGEAFQFADESLKKDKDFLLEIARESAKAFKYVDKELKDDAEFMVKVLEKNKHIFDELTHEQREAIRAYEDLKKQ